MSIFVIDCMTFTQDCLFFYQQEQMSQVLDAIFDKIVLTGEHVIDQDDDGDNFYVIER